MTDDITALVHLAAPTEVRSLDLERARREARHRSRRRTTVTAAASVAVVASAAVVTTTWPTDSGVTVGPAPGGTDVAAEQAAAGCLAVPGGDLDDRNHFDLLTAPPADVMYEVPLPSSGPHLATVSDVPDRVPEVPLDVRAVVHNLEHGAIAIWLDPAQLTPETFDDIATWADTRRRQGFAQDAGVNLIVSPIPPEADEAAPISLRAWGVALDCASWSQTVADHFVATHYGSRGSAPEGFLGPYPSADPLD